MIQKNIEEFVIEDAEEKERKNLEVKRDVNVLSDHQSQEARQNS